MIEKDLVIIGGGSAGMAAAIKAHELGIKDILILEKNNYLGGILNQCIHNGFGLKEFNEELTGPEFMNRLADKVKESGINFKLSSYVLNITKNKIVTFTNSIDGVTEVQAKTIILTAGCYERSAGTIQIPGSRPSGVYTAGQAQLYLNCYGYLVGKKVFILGSGDIGLIMARRMTLEGAKVLGVAELMPYSAGLNRNIVQCLNDFDIPLYLSTSVKTIIGKDKLEKVVIAQVDDKRNFIPGTEKEIECDTLLLSVGLVPNSTLLNNLGINFSKTKGPIVDQNMETNIPGIFAAGNVLHVHDLVDYVCDEAREASKGAFKYLQNKETKSNRNIEVKALNGISYVVPQHISIDRADDEIIFKFRVNRPYKDINIFFRQNNTIIKKIIKPAIVPSEMEITKIKKELFGSAENPIEVYVEEIK